MSARPLNRLPTARPLLHAGFGLALLVIGSSALAQDAANGKLLYTSKACATAGCHNPDPSANFQGILSGANDPQRILSECATERDMIGFCGSAGFLKVSLAEATDIAAYLANPNGGAPAISLNNQSLSFRRSIGGGASAAQTVTLTNSGTADLALTTVALGGANAADFKLAAPASGTQCTSGLTLAAKASCSVNITFDPSVAASRSATLTFTPAAATGLSASTVTLAGVGTQAAEALVTLDTSTLAYGNVTLNSKGTKAVTLTSSGEAALTLAAANTFVVSGTNAAEFVVDTAASTCTAGSTLAVGSSCTVQLAFTPTATGARSGTLTVASNAAAATTVTLSGTGVNAEEEDAGGCSIARSGGRFDPLLLGLLAAAAAVLGLRRRRQGGR